MESAMLIIEVVAGLIPGRDPLPEFTKRWAITSREWSGCKDDSHRIALLADRAALADHYASTLRDPNRVNWVRTDWVWL